MDYWIELLEWPAMALTVLAAWCIGSRRPGRRRLGFSCFLASNLLWAIWGWQVQAWALIILQACLCAMNLRGWRKNTALQRRPGGVPVPNPACVSRSPRS